MNNKKMLLKSLLFVFIIIACLLVIAFSPLRAYFSPEYLAQLKSEFGGNMVLFTCFYTLAGSVLIAIGFPRTIFCIIAGMLYDLWAGVLIGQIAAIGGAYATYFLSGKLARPFFQEKVARHIGFINNFSRCNPAIFVALLRQAPVPGIVTNSISGVMNISPLNFLLGSFIGFLPQSVIFCLFGSSVNDNFMLHISIAFILFLIMIIGVKLYLNRKFGVKPVKTVVAPTEGTQVVEIAG